MPAAPDGMEPLRDTCRGRWRGILVELGASSKVLSGKHVPCPFCGGKDRFRFDDKNGDGRWICSQCGAGDGAQFVMNMRGVEFKEAAALIRPLAGVVPVRSSKPEASAEEKTEWMRKLWNGARPIESDDPAGMWLRHRAGLEAFPGALRFHDAVPHRARDGGRAFGPGMLALVRNIEGEPVNVHRTLLDYRGQKADIETPRATMPGDLPPGAAVRLQQHTDRLGIAEGIETALAAAALHALPCWAALNAGQLAKWEPPSGIGSVVIFGDNDESFTGQSAAFTLARRLRVKNKIEVDVRIPPDADQDWQDVWAARNGVSA